MSAVWLSRALGFFWTEVLLGYFELGINVETSDEYIIESFKASNAEDKLILLLLLSKLALFLHFLCFISFLCLDLTLLIYSLVLEYYTSLNGLR